MVTLPIPKRKEVHVGSTQRKLLLILQAGVALSFAGTLGKQWRILREVGGELEKIEKQRVKRAIEALYASRLIDAKRNPDGTSTLILNEGGKERALTYHVHRMKIRRPAKWDSAWRLVSFDIPEHMREARNAIRGHLLRLGFYEMHQSFFIFAFPCQDELDYLIELYDLRKYVRCITATNIDVDDELRKFFGFTGHHDTRR